MSAMIQLDFFKTKEESAIDCLVVEFEKVKDSSDRVRKGTYARINALNKECEELKTRLHIIERNICKEETLKH